MRGFEFGVQDTQQREEHIAEALARIEQEDVRVALGVGGHGVALGGSSRRGSSVGRIGAVTGGTPRGHGESLPVGQERGC